MKANKIFNFRNIVIAIGALLIGIAILVIISLNQDDGIKKTRTTIAGLPNDIPANTKGLIEAGLYDVIALNISNDEIPPESGAVIRNSTLETNYDDETDIYYGSFITDISSVKQSFTVHYEWSKNSQNLYLSGYPVEITCVDKADRIYETTYCSDAFHESDPAVDDFANEYLPYMGQTESGVDYSIIKDYQDRNPTITVVSYTCEGSDDANAVKKDAKAWLIANNNNLDLDTVEFKNYCDGMMSNFPALRKVN